jgi:hypothetical protein
VAVVSASLILSNHAVMSVFHLLMSVCKYVLTVYLGLSRLTLNVRQFVFDEL